MGRCFNPKNRKYAIYGAKGITVHGPWREDFAAFLADIGPRPSPQYSLDRYPDPNGNYVPGNVRWATLSEQNRNRKGCFYLHYQGQRRHVCEWADLIGISPLLLRHRLNSGWSVHDTLTIRPKLGNRRNLSSLSPKPVPVEDVK